MDSIRTPPSEDGDYSKHWAWDLRVPVAQLIFLGAQCAALIWWAAKTDSRIDVLEHAYAAVPARLESMVRLEAKVDYLSQQMIDMKGTFQVQLDELKKTLPTKR